VLRDRIRAAEIVLADTGELVAARDAVTEDISGVYQVEPRLLAKAAARFRQRYEAALPALARSLSKLILSSFDYNNLESHARAIVQTRNEMRGTITDLNSLLNSEIDRLQEILGNPKKDKAERESELLKTIQTLQIIWKDGKVERIQILLRRLLAESGLAEIFSGAAPA
jgi:hypothetical protein